ncbi:hypothetical protein Ocin01_13402 [Orchesella cincta]|uniref:Death domain-containing protein n=1 Tax=Orchesella cincta TaxID=48709 RepID=A0A1D2MJY6_ORCCI|nr:hypothetical protein Ocin01_13402 [Orchesella cincta]
MFSTSKNQHKMENLSQPESRSKDESLKLHDRLNKLVVGSKDCPTQTVFDILAKSSSASAVYQKLSGIAFNLYNSSETINEINKKLSSDPSFSNNEALNQVLENWVENRGHHATMLELYSVLGRHGIRDAADELYQAYFHSGK